MADVKLVVFVDGGLVQEIFSNVPTEVLILDQDIEGCDETKMIQDWDSKKGVPSAETFEAFDTRPWDPFVQPAAVEHFFNEMAKESEGSEDADEVVPEVQEAEGKGE